MKAEAHRNDGEWARRGLGPFVFKQGLVTSVALCEPGLLNGRHISRLDEGNSVTVTALRNEGSLWQCIGYGRMQGEGRAGMSSSAGLKVISEPSICRRLQCTGSELISLSIQGSLRESTLAAQGVVAPDWSREISMALKTLWTCGAHEGRGSQRAHNTLPTHPGYRVIA